MYVQWPFNVTARIARRGGSDGKGHGLLAQLLR
jgi:hypothetical protein